MAIVLLFCLLVISALADPNVRSQRESNLNGSITRGGVEPRFVELDGERERLFESDGERLFESNGERERLFENDGERERLFEGDGQRQRLFENSGEREGLFGDNRWNTEGDGIALFNQRNRDGIGISEDVDDSPRSSRQRVSSRDERTRSGRESDAIYTSQNPFETLPNIHDENSGIYDYQPSRRVRGSHLETSNLDPPRRQRAGRSDSDAGTDLLAGQVINEDD